MTYARIPAWVCPECNGSGTRRIGTNDNLICPGCDGQGQCAESGYVSPPLSEQDRAAYRAWCAEQDARLAAQVDRELRFVMELERKDKAA